MKSLTIYCRYFTKADCYKSGTKQKSTGVQVHSTGANNPYLHRYVGPDDGRIGPNKYNNVHNNPGRDVCASAYIGKLQDGTVAVYQALPWDVRCWLSGKGGNGNANRLGYVGYEICEDGLKDEKYFRSVYDSAVMLTAHLCQMFGVKPETIVKSFRSVDAIAVMDHNELHDAGLASNHGDITHWLRKFGMNMNDFRSSVSDVMAEGIDVKYIDCDAPTEEEEMDEDVVLYIAKAVNLGAYLNIRLNKSKKSNSIGTVMRGDTVEVLNDSDPDWWKIRKEGVVGYSMTHSGDQVYLVSVSEDPVEDGVVPKTFTVTISGLDFDSATKFVELYPGKAVSEEE